MLLVQGDDVRFLGACVNTATQDYLCTACHGLKRRFAFVSATKEGPADVIVCVECLQEMNSILASAYRGAGALPKRPKKPRRT